MKKVINVLIVDDSRVVQKKLTKLLSMDEEINIIGTADNGLDAVKKANSLDVHCITMDFNMPVMDGIKAVKLIMEKNPIPIIMLSSYTSHGARETIKALENGAVDFVQKPSGEGAKDLELIMGELIKKIKYSRFARVKISLKKTTLNKRRKITEKPEKKPDVVRSFPVYNSNYDRLITGIGISTGGPKLLKELIPQLPEKINGAIVIAQHMPESFTKEFAKHLDTLSSIRVCEIQDKMKIEDNTVYIAKGSCSTFIDKNLVFRLVPKSSEFFYYPSADVLLMSISKLKNVDKLGIILTGMGNDGSKGIIAIKNNNGETIAQDEESCVIFGMPSAAIKTGKIDKILPPDEIIDYVIKKYSQ